MEQISRIEQIYYELSAVARIQDPEERRRILREYHRELEAVGCLKSSIKGTWPGLKFEDWVKKTPHLDEDRKHYGAALAKCLNLEKDAIEQNRRLQAYRARFEGAREAFWPWFHASSDKEVSELFNGTYKGDRLPWIGKLSEAVLFAIAIAEEGKRNKLERLNKFFKHPDPKKADFKFRSGNLGYDRRKGDENKSKRALPEIIKIIERFQPLSDGSKRMLSNDYEYDTKTLKKGSLR